MAAKFCYEKYTCGGENSSRSLSVSYERLYYEKHAVKDEQLSKHSSVFKSKKTQDIQLEESQKLWTLKVLHVVFKFHIRMDDSGHQLEK